MLAALKEMGIAEEDIQTSGYSVFSERYSPDGTAATEVQYRVTNTVNVLIRDLDKVGAVLDASIEAGANNIYGVEFLLDDPTAARSAARQMAVENAAATATELAGLTGVEVGPIVSISEVIGNNGGFYSNQFTQFSTGASSGRLPTPGGTRPAAADHAVAGDLRTARLAARPVATSYPWHIARPHLAVRYFLLNSY